jgi:hypothetical protein
MVRRLKQEMKTWEYSAVVLVRLEPDRGGLFDQEREVHRALREYTELRITGATDGVEKICDGVCFKTIKKKRLFSLPPKPFATFGTA